MSQLARKLTPEYILIVVDGPDKGTKYKLSPGKITIGRSSENSIALNNDSKMSRTHAEINITDERAEIIDLSDRKKLLINGQPHLRHQLSVGDVIQMGETQFHFKMRAPEQALAEVKKAHHHPMPSPSLKPRGRAKKSNNFYIVAAVVGIALIWILTQGDGKKSTPQLDNLDGQKQINANQKIIDDVQSQKEKMGLNSRQYAEAQPNFIKGFRDYRKGQFERAVESFQACLSLFPQHVQCRTYLDRSLKKYSELVQYHMVLANKYRSQNQYTACKASYRNVMVMLKNSSDKTYQEAKSGYDTCDALEGDRY